MNNIGRYWWAFALVGVLFMLAAPVALMWMFASLPPIGEFFSVGDRNLLVGAGLFVCIAYFVVGLYFLTISLHERRREQRRRAALRGDLNAMPLARYAADASAAPDVTAEPLVLQWRATRSEAYTNGVVFIVVVLLLLLVLLGGPIFGWYVFLTSNPKSLMLDAGTVALFAYLILGPLVGILLTVLLLRVVPWVFGRPFGVTATADGIEQLTEFGTRRYLRWGDMRLFEISADGPLFVAANRSFCVYGDRRRLVWLDPPGRMGQHVPAGMTPAEMAYRHRLLVNLIYARTGLAPRTLTKSLQIAEPATDTPQAPAAPKVARNGWFTWASALFVLAFAALIAGAAVAAVMLPASPYAALNLVIALSLALGALALVVVVGWIVVRIVTRDRESPLPQPPVVAAPALDGPAGARTLTYTLTPLVRAALLLGGALLLGNLVPPLMLFGNVFLNLFRPLSDYVFTESLLAPFFSSALMVPGLAGVIMLRTAFQEGRAQVRADAQGIRHSLGRRRTTLRWDGVEKVEGRARNGRIVSYLLTGELGATQVGWRTRSTWYLRLAPAVGAAAITPDEMAALAVRASGKPLRIEPMT